MIRHPVRLWQLLSNISRSAPLALGVCALVGTSVCAADPAAPGSGAVKPGTAAPVPMTPKGAAPAQTTPPKAEPAPADPTAPTSEDDRQVLRFTANRIDGASENLAAYRGKVVLIVNTASQCGLTPQYEGLQRLYEAHKDQGLIVLGFPANDFRQQEPGTNKEIAAFCSTRYQVTFPLFEKVSVLGPEAHPLFQALTRLAAAQMTDEEKSMLKPDQTPGAPSWNFTKYLVDRDGHLAQRFDPRTKPDDAVLAAKIAELLAAKPADPAAQSTPPITPSPAATPGKPDAGTSTTTGSPATTPK